MSVEELHTTLPEALARATVAMPNSQAWATMQARLAEAGIKRPSEVREAAWRARKALKAERS